MLESIGQIAINVKDTARARAFYRDVLGLRHLFDAGPNLAFFQCGGVRLMLSPASKPEYDHPGSIIYYKVADLAATHAAMAGQGRGLRAGAAPGRHDAGPRAVDGLPARLRGQPPRADGGEAPRLTRAGR